uniref:Aldedh domain-containing protein n=1 Tax=Steinernema glaseri TaxID=37863 RepID=A0A1I8ANS2_9BILA
MHGNGTGTGTGYISQLQWIQKSINYFSHLRLPKVHRL